MTDGAGRDGMDVCGGTWTAGGSTRMVVDPVIR